MDSFSSSENDSGSEWEPSGSDSESDLSDEATCDFDEAWDWFRVDCTSSCSPPERFPFTEVPGLKFLLEDPTDPLQYFMHLFDDDVIEHVICKTNENAKSFLSLSQSVHCRAKSWLDIGKPELLRFLALLILQSIQPKPSARMYWSRSPVVETPFFGKVMSERKFGLIWKFLGCFDTMCMLEKSQISQLNRDPFFRLLMQKYSCSYIMEREISVDESPGFSNPKKKFIGHSRSLKFFYLCESSSGYVSNALLYNGIKTDMDAGYSKCKRPTKIAMTLLRNHLGRGHCVTLGSYFTSPELAGALEACGTDVYGVLKPVHKGLPWELRSERLEKRHMIAFRKGKMTIIKWQEKRRPIFVLTTVHSIQVCKDEKQDKYVKRPLAVVDYDRTLKRLDRMDLVNEVARPHTRNVCKKLFRHLVNLTVWNAYVLYSKCGGALDIVSFEVKLIERMVEEFGSYRLNYPQAFPGSVQNPFRYCGGHFPAHVPKTGQKVSPTRRCVVCSDKMNELGKRVRRETRYYCEVCNVGLCVAPCFGIYHTKQ